MKKNVLLLSVIIAFIFFACEGEVMLGYKLYENEEHSFTIQYPSDWKVHEKDIGSPNSIVMFVSEMESKADSHLENVYIFTEPLDSGMTLEGFYKRSVKNLPDLVLDFVIIEKGDTLLGNMNSKYIYFSYITGNKQAHNLAYLFTKDSTGYVISCTGDPTRFEEFRPTFVKVCSTFKFD